MSRFGTRRTGVRCGPGRSPTPPIDWSPPPPPKQRHIGRWILGGLAALMIVGLASGSDDDTAPVVAGGSIGDDTTSSYTAPKTSNTTASMVTWAAENSDDIDGIIAALTVAAEGAGDGDVDEMVRGCRLISRAVTASQANLPVPDAN